MANFFDQFDAQQPEGNFFDQFDKPEKKGFGQRVSEDFAKRQAMVDQAKAATRRGDQSQAEYLLQGFGKGGLGLVNDIIGQSVVSAGRGLSAITPDVIETPIKQGASNVAGFISDSFAGDLARQAASGYSQFAENNPRAARNIEAATNIGLLGLSATPIKGQSVVGAVADTAGVVAKPVGKAVGVVAKAPVSATIGSVKIANKVLEGAGKVASEAVVKSNLPENLRNIPKAEALFLRTLQNEGVSIDDAISVLSEARKAGVSPSIAAAAEIPSMKEMGFLMGRGSQGSKVAAQAIKDIETRQIPKLNEEIIKRATGGQALSAEKYGQTVAKMAKETIDAKKRQLATRASPYYRASVGIDKSVDIQNPLMKNALSNPMVVKALDDWRVDPATLTNVQKELAEMGVDSAELTKLPYNSTVSLHAARTHLRGLRDSAFRSGDSQSQKAIKFALDDIDNAIESQFPQYKIARKIYSEDAGALKTLNESPLGVMAKVGEGDVSKIANSFMSKDPEFINKFFSKVKTAGGNEQKMRDSIAGAFLQRKLEDSAKEGLRFSDAVLKNQTTRNQLRAVIGQEKFDKIEAVNKIIDDLNETRGMVQGSRTSAVQSIRDEAAEAVIPTSRGELLMQLKAKYVPSLIDMVKNDPAQAARFNELLFTDEGLKLLESFKGTNKLTVGDQNKLAKFFNLNKQKVK
jgi:hypothetical protein